MDWEGQKWTQWHKEWWGPEPQLNQQYMTWWAIGCGDCRKQEPEYLCKENRTFSVGDGDDEVN